MLTTAQTQHFHDYGYTTAPTLFDATEIRAMRAGLERFKRERLGQNAAIAWNTITHST